MDAYTNGGFHLGADGLLPGGGRVCAAASRLELGSKPLLGQRLPGWLRRRDGRRRLLSSGLAHHSDLIARGCRGVPVRYGGRGVVCGSRWLGCRGTWAPRGVGLIWGP